MALAAQIRSRGDLILNPFDARSVTWDLFGEIQEPYDIDNLGHSLIADAEGSAAEWRAFARVFLAEVTRYCHNHGIRDLSELRRLLAPVSNEELRKVLTGSPAAGVPLGVGLRKGQLPFRGPRELDQ